VVGVEVEVGLKKELAPVTIRLLVPVVEAGKTLLPRRLKLEISLQLVYQRKKQYFLKKHSLINVPPLLRMLVLHPTDSKD
jgi:hypothetical protein